MKNARHLTLFHTDRENVKKSERKTDGKIQTESGLPGHRGHCG